MGRYTTLNEEILRYNSMAGIETQPDNSGEKQNKEILLSDTVDEATDQDKYEEVVFMQGQEADEPLSILDKKGEDAALDYLKQWHFFGSHMGSDESGHGDTDQTYEKDGYIMFWNVGLSYIGLQYKFPEEDETNYGELNENVDKVILERVSNQLNNLLTGVNEDNQQLGNKKYLKTWKHEALIGANNPEDAHAKWAAVNLGNLDSELKQGHILSHDFIETVNFVDENNNEIYPTKLY